MNRLKINLNKSIFVVLAILFLCLPKYAYCIPAFPGAEGFGAETIGGRLGQIIKVTNLNNSGPGSLRAAVEMPRRNYANGIYEWESLDAYNTSLLLGKRPPRHWLNSTYKWESMEVYTARLESVGHKIIIFETSGIINLKSTLTINTPYLTIAGQTSPGGILITGYQTTLNTHDVIIQHMRFRVGSHRIPDGADPEKLDSFDILGKYWAANEAYNIIIDHSSFSWGVDETFTVSGGVLNLTIQRSIISEGLKRAGHPKGEHSKGLLISGKYKYPNSVSIHHNYIAHNTARNPLIYSPKGVETIADVVNNVSYNWKGGLSPLSGGSVKINWVHNYAKQGVRSNSYSFEVTHSNRVTPAISQIYVEGNIGSTRLAQSAPQWNVGIGWRNELLSEDYRQLTRWAAPSINTTEMSYNYAIKVLENVGATAPFRDSVDERVVADFAKGTGDTRDNVVFPDDFPVFQNITPPVDSDNDGMSDSWEISQGFNTSKNDSAEDKNNNGYTNIEEYLYYLSTGVLIPAEPSKFKPPAPSGFKIRRR